ncbi:unnamed protein product [Larinioides sclopetarius]
MTIASLYGLYEDLMPLDVKFYDHPLPSEVKHRIRLLLLGKNVDDIPFSSATNTLPCEDKSLLTTELLVHMSPDLNECGNQSEIQEITTNEVSSSELTAIVDSSECLNDFSPDCSTEGLKYLAGYIAHKCRKYDRSLAIPSGRSLAISSKEKTWIEVLSRGGRLIPTDEWFEQIKKFEETFIEMHVLPARYVFALLGFFGFFNVYAMRVNLSVAIIAMVKPSNNSNNTVVEGNIACHELLEDINYENSSLSKSVPGGMFAEKYGAKWLFGGGMLLTSLFTLLTPIAARWNIWALVAARVIEGLGEGVAFPAMNTLIGQWAPKLERSRMGSFIYTGSNIGTVVTLAVSGVLSDKVGWPAVFYIFGGLGCVWFILWAILVFETPEVHPKISKEELDLIREGRENKTRPPTPWKSILTSIPLWALVIAHTGQSWGFYTFFIQMPMYLSNILHFDLNKNGVLSALPNLMLSLISIVVSILADKLRKSGKLRITVIRKIFNTIGFVGPALCLIAVSFSGCRPTLIVALLSLGMGLNGFAYSGFIVTHVDMSPDFAGTLYGITNFFSNFTGFLVPAYVGWIMQKGQTVENWAIVFITASIVLSAAAIVYDAFCSAELQPWGVDEKSNKDEINGNARTAKKEEFPLENDPYSCSSKL